MYVLKFFKDGEELYTVSPDRKSDVHQNLLQIFEEYNKLLLLRGQTLSFFNSLFVRQVRDVCVNSGGAYSLIQFYHKIPDRVDVKYLR